VHLCRKELRVRTVVYRQVELFTVVQRCATHCQHIILSSPQTYSDYKMWHGSVSRNFFFFLIKLNAILSRAIKAHRDLVAYNKCHWRENNKVKFKIQ
jgi:hypothetical protein